MKKFYGALVVLLLLTPFNSAFAKGGQSWLLGVDLSYISTKTESVGSGSTTTSNGSATYYDLVLGYYVGSNTAVGLMYSTKNYKDDGATVSSSTPANATGAMVNYTFDNGIYFTGAYFLSATDNTLKKGSGYEIDFGWRHFISNSFFLGSKVAYRSLKYTDVPGLDSYTITTMMPYISLGVAF